MCNEFDKNRQKLVALMYSRERFTKRQLIREFARKNNGNIRIAGYQSVGSLIDEMTGYGELQKSGHSYKLLPVDAF